MAIITGLIGLLGRFAGQLLNTTMGWATLLLFGKVPQKRQQLLLLIVFGSLIWVALVIGVLVPGVGLLILAAVPLPELIDPAWVRLAMLAGALLLPLLLGLAAVFVTGNTAGRSPASLLTAALRGYPFALVLTLILALLVVVGAVRKARSLSRRWEDAHVPMIVKPGGYEEVLARVSRTLSDAGLEHSARDAGALLSGPPRLLDKIAGRGLGDLVPDHLMILGGSDFEVLVYPSDLAISGARRTVARARAALASRVSDAPAYLTASAEAQELEDELDDIRARRPSEGPARTLERVRATDARLARLAVPFTEWQTVYRERLQIERDVLVNDEPLLADDEPPRGGRAAPRAELAAAVAGLGLVALDVALVFLGRRGRAEKPPRR